MAVSRDEIGQWFDEAIQEGATHMLIVCDTFDFTEFPVEVAAGEDPQEKADEFNEKEMIKVTEVYDLSLDKDAQLGQTRAWNTGPAPTRDR